MNVEHPSLGRIIRRIRQDNDWTLKEMSESTGIPISTLSKVERDVLTLTYDKLQKLSQGLGVSLSELFADTEVSKKPRVTARRSIGDLSTAYKIETKHYDYYNFCPDLRKKRMLPGIIEVRAKSLDDIGDLPRHEGEEFIYVLSGTIVVQTEFYDPVTLHEGESIYLDSTMGHSYLVAEGCDVAQVLGVCTNETDRPFGGFEDQGQPSRTSE